MHIFIEINRFRYNVRIKQWFSTFFGARHTIIYHTFSRHTLVLVKLKTTTTSAILPEATVIAKRLYVYVPMTFLATHLVHLAAQYCAAAHRLRTTGLKYISRRRRYLYRVNNTIYYIVTRARFRMATVERPWEDAKRESGKTKWKNRKTKEKKS